MVGVAAGTDIGRLDMVGQETGKQQLVAVRCPEVEAQAFPLRQALRSEGG